MSLTCSGLTALLVTISFNYHNTTASFAGASDHLLSFANFDMASSTEYQGINIDRIGELLVQSKSICMLNSLNVNL